MNRVLLDPHEVDAAGRATLTGRRARHLLDVVGVAPGRALRIGVLDGAKGSANVTATTDDSVTLECAFEAAAESPQPADTLLLAIPRPKVLTRILEDAATMGFAHVALVRAWRSDKSHLGSAIVTDAELRDEHLRRGLEQGGSTRLPRVSVHPLFRPFVEDALEALLPADALRIVADAGAETTLAAHAPVNPDRPLVAAIGPERGWNEFELELLRAHGFADISLGPCVLRVETAAAAIWAQFCMLRQTASPHSA